MWKIFDFGHKHETANHGVISVGGPAQQEMARLKHMRLGKDSDYQPERIRDYEGEVETLHERSARELKSEFLARLRREEDHGLDEHGEPIDADQFWHDHFYSKQQPTPKS